VIRGRSIVTMALGVAAVFCLCRPACAIDLQGDVAALGQVRDGNFSRETEAPMNLYGNLGASGLWGRTSTDTYFRLQRDFARDDGDTDFYAGYADVSGLAPGLQFIGGRQFIGEGPGGVFVADAGRVRYDPGGPLAFTVYGGRPQYFEPTYSSNLLSQDETLFGGNVHTTKLKGGQIGIGYMQLERQDRVLRQLVTGTFSQLWSQLPGTPNAYGSFAFDADRQNVDLGTLGLNFFSIGPRLPFLGKDGVGGRLMLNLEGTYYKPQDQGERPTPDIDRREDPIFQLFSVSDLVQARGGLRYPFTPSLSLFGDYSYQHYEATDGEHENGHVASAGVDWLPEGDGLEIVRLEYYLADSGGGNANGARFYYENRYYDRILFRFKVDVTYYDKQSNQDDVPVATLVGLGYELWPGLSSEVYMEANRNDRFASDFRFGFLISYNFRHRLDRPGAAREGA
jgi:hypothetical protein